VEESLVTSLKKKKEGKQREKNSACPSRNPFYADGSKGGGGRVLRAATTPGRSFFVVAISGEKKKKEGEKKEAKKTEPPRLGVSQKKGRGENVCSEGGGERETQPWSQFRRKRNSRGGDRGAWLSEKKKEGEKTDPVSYLVHGKAGGHTSTLIKKRESSLYSFCSPVPRKKGGGAGISLRTRGKREKKPPFS